MNVALQQWLNNEKRDYGLGVELYNELRPQGPMIPIFLRGATEPNKGLLFAELRKIYYELKCIAVDVHVSALEEAVKVDVVLNPDLEAACKSEADKAYKLLANTKARLFYYTTVEPEKSENSADLVAIRQKLVFEVLAQQPVVDRLYWVYRFVKANGHLPEAQEKPVEVLPDSPVLMERKRTNLLKNISKLKNKEQTPARVALLQQHIENLKLINDGIDKLLQGG